MELRTFQRTVWDYYNAHGRHDLPWRTRVTAYRVLVSEVMLQQTQVDRVIPKFQSWMKQFPTFKKLSESSLRDVLLEWKGLGYNNRAKRLHDVSRVVMGSFSGRLPRSYGDLIGLPGIGDYTASAVVAFAYDEPIVVLDTNVRRIYIHHFFPDVTDVHDRDIRMMVEGTMDRERPREWFSALMDYGSYLGRTLQQNPNQKSRHYTKQSKFEGSVRQMRSTIMDVLLAHPEGISQEEVRKILAKDIEKNRLDTQFQAAYHNLTEELGLWL